MNPLIYVFVSILFVTVSQLLFKHGITLIEQQPKPENMPKWKSILRMLFQPHVFGGLFCNGLAAVCWLLALSKLDLSYVFPFISLNYILVPIAAAWILKEKLSKTRMTGIAVICVGVFLIAFS